MTRYSIETLICSTVIECCLLIKKIHSSSRYWKSKLKFFNIIIICLFVVVVYLFNLFVHSLWTFNFNLLMAIRDCLEKEMVECTMPGSRARGRPRTSWLDNIKSWTGWHWRKYWVGMCGMDFSSSVRFWEYPRFWFGFEKTVGSVLFVDQFSCKMQKKRLRCLSCISYIFNLNFNLNHIVFVYKNVKALWQWLKYWLLYETSSVLRKATETEISGLTFWFGSGF